jgi:uncharacterized membrane protein
MNQKRERILLFLIFTFCLAIRLAFISQKNLWFDEVFSWHLSLDSFYEIIVRTTNDIHPPLYYFILKIWGFMFGDSVTALRLISTLFSSAAIFFIYPVCRRIMDPLNSFIVIILYSISPLNLYYSQEVRMSAMNLFFNAGSAYFLLLMIDRLKSNAVDWKLFLKDKMFYLYVLFTVSALYTHYFSFFLIAAQLAYLAVLFKGDLRKYKPFIIAYNFILALYLLWIPTMFLHLAKGQSWRNPQSLFMVMREYWNYLKDVNLGLYYHYTDLTLVKIIAVFSGMVILIAVAGIILKRNKNSGNTLMLVILLVLVPLILAGLISFKQKVEFYRYLSIIIPYILIITVYGLNRWDKKLITYPVICCIFFINIFGISLHYSFDFKNDDYRSIVKQINVDYKAGDRIYTEPHYYGWLIYYYKKQWDLQIPKTAYIRYGWNEALDSINIQQPERFWVVFDYSAVDTTKYSTYLNDLNTRFDKDFYRAYYTAPYRIDLYRFKQK